MNELAHAFAAARRIFRRGVDPTTFVATFFLPRAKREAVHAVGAFVYLTLDALAKGLCAQPCDAGCGTTHGDEILTLAREKIEAVFAGKLELPRLEFRDDGQWTLHAAARSVPRYEIPIQPMLELVDGLVADATVLRYATWRSLGEHCRRTGGNIATLMTAILGATHSDTAYYASQIGQAAWLTRILRGLRNELSGGCVSLPLEDLVRVRCGEKDLLALRATDESRELIRLEVARARELFHAGAEGLCWLAGDGSRLAAATFVSGQLALLDAIERDPASILRGDLRVSPARRLRRLPDAWRLARRQAAEPLPTLLLMTTPTASPDAWRRIAAPGGYEGWHFSATSDDQTTHLVAALHATWALDRTYLRRYRTYRRRPTRVAPPIAAEYPAVTFALYERGRRAIVVAARATKDQFSADPAGQSVRVNASHAQRAAGGVLNLNLRGGTRDGRTLAAKLAFRPHVREGVEVALVTPDAQCGAHGWVVADPLCDVNGEVSIFDSALGAPRVIPFAGVGCHDHLWGTRAMEDAAPQWIGGRILREEHAVLFRSIHPRLAHVCDVRAGETPQLRQATLTTEGVRRTWRGLAYPAALTIEGVADLAEPKIVDSSWHSLVLEYRATVGDDRSLALVELLRPARRIWCPPW